jgi:hypothetical protein
MGEIESHFWNNLKAGSRGEMLGVEVKSILHKTGTFVVYLDTEIDLQWIETFSKEDSAHFATVLNRVGYLVARSEFLRHMRSDKTLINARNLIGEGLIQLLSTQNEAEANVALDTAEKFIDQRGTECSRLWYFLPFNIFFAISLAILLVCLVRDPNFAKTLPLACCIAGGVGAFISSAMGNTRIPCAPSAGRKLHYLEATIRWGMGLGAGVLVYLPSKGNIAVGLLCSGTSGNNYGLLAVALLSGASEALLPSLIKKFDDSESQTTTKDRSKDDRGKAAQ